MSQEPRTTGDDNLSKDMACSLAQQSERLLVVESLAREALDVLGKATQAAASSQLEEASSADRISSLEKSQKSILSQLEELSRFMIGLAGDHEMLEARTGDELKNLEVRRQRLSLQLNTRLLQEGKASKCASTYGSCSSTKSAGDTATLLHDIRDEIGTFRTGLTNVGSQLDELSRGIICLTGDHEVLEARMNDQIDSLEQGRRRLSSAVKALKWPEPSAPEPSAPEPSATCDRKELECFFAEMKIQLQQELKQHAESWREQLVPELTAKQHLSTDDVPVQKAMLEQHAKLELRVASAESQVNVLEGLLPGFFDRCSASADRKIEGLRAELLREQPGGVRADQVSPPGNAQVGTDAVMEAVHAELQACLRQEEATRANTLAELRAQVQQSATERGELLAAIQSEESARSSAVAEVAARLQEVANQHEKQLASMREELSTACSPSSCDGELRGKEPLAQEVSCLRAEVSALRSEQSFTAARAEGRHAALEVGLSDTRRLVVSSSAQATRRLDSFEVAATVTRRSLDMLMESQMQRAGTDRAPLSGADENDPLLPTQTLRASGLEIIAHELRDNIDRQGTRLGRSEEWLQSLVAKSGDAERRLQQLEKRLPKSLREAEEPLEDALAQLTTGVLKMAQLLGVASEDMCEKLGWRDACWDLPRMMDHAWLRSRLPKRASVIKILRQKADSEQVRQLQEQFEMCYGGGESSFRSSSGRAGAEDLSASEEAVGRATVGRATGPRFGAGNSSFLASTDAAMARNRARSTGVHRPPASPDPRDSSHSGRPIIAPPPQDNWADLRRSRDEQQVSGPASFFQHSSACTSRAAESPRVRAGNVAAPRDAWGGPGPAGFLAASELTTT